MTIPRPEEGFLLTHFIVSRDIAKAAAFYSGVLGGTIVHPGEPTIIQLQNAWVTINVGGGPTPDKPTVYLETPTDLDRVTSFLNIRVADIQDCYRSWKEKGAQFITPPMDRGVEFRCYMRDPDGHLIEVGQTK